MTDLPNPPESSDDDTGMPRWVKVFGIIAIVLVVLFAIRHLSSGGFANHMR